MSAVTLTRKQKLAFDRPPFEATIHSLSHDGRGIADIEGKKTFIFGALPGERVMFRYTAVHKRLDEGRVVEVLTPAPERVVPDCEAFGRCGGCQLQHMAPEAQRAHKQAHMLTQLEHSAKVTPKVVLPPLVGPTLGYRRKARLGMRYVAKKEKFLIGFREQHSNKLAEMDACEVLWPAMSDLLPALATCFGQLAAFKDLPQVEVSVGTGENEQGLILRHLTPLAEADLAKLKDFAVQHNLQLFLQPKGPDSIHCIVPGPEKQYLQYQLAAEGLTFDFLPSSFTQVNHEMNASMLQQALDLLQPQAHERVLDLFCGIGNFSLPLARRVQAVVGVEGSQTAIDCAHRNATNNDIKNASFHVQDLTLPPAVDWAQATYDSVLLDPPRTGALALMPWLLNCQPNKILYISCQPATMARDAAVLIQGGYTLTHAGIMDMFPHTAHVESMALFELKPRC